MSERKLKVIEEVKFAAIFVFAGLLVCLGYRAGEWLIPAPETRVLVCMADETGTLEVCRHLDRIIKKSAEENHGNR